MSKKKYVVITENITPVQERAVVNTLGPYVGWSHHFANSWLVVDHAGTSNVAQIRDTINIALSGAAFIVLEVEAKSWASMMRTDPISQSQVKWISETWQS